MATIVVAQRMYQRRGTAAEWTTKNPVLAAGEIGVELGNPAKIKIGDGSTAWTGLAYGSAQDILDVFTAAPVTETLVGTERILLLKDGALVAAPVQAVEGADGEPGQTAIEMRVSGGYLQYRNIGETAWYNLVLLSALNQGSDVRLRSDTPSGYIQYSNDAGLTWTNLVTLASLKGATGNTGPTGPTGLSAYQVAVANGYADTQVAWLASLRGEQGIQGVQGPPGIPSQRRIQRITNTDAGSITCDWNAYDEIRVVLTTNTQVNMTGALDGQGCVLLLKQDATGGRSVTLGAMVRFNNLIPTYVATLTPSKADRLGFVYDGDAGVYDLQAVVDGI